MRVRQFVIAVAAAAISVAASAEPSNTPVRNPVEGAQTQAPLVVASAQPVRTPSGIAEAQSAAPAKRVRTARVSTCRCGGQTPASN